MNLELTDDEAAALLRELDGLIDGDRYFPSQRIKTLKVIRAKIRPEPVRPPLPPPPKPYEPPRATAAHEVVAEQSEIVARIALGILTIQAAGLVVA